MSRLACGVLVGLCVACAGRGLPGQAGPWKEKKTAAVGPVEVAVERISKQRAFGEQDGRPFTATDEQWLFVHLKITNTSDTKKFDYTGWCRQPQNVLLVDEFDNKYAMKENGPGVLLYFVVQGGENPRQIQQADLMPGKAISDFLVFKWPVEKAKQLTLILPGENLGLLEPFVLKFSPADIAK